MRRLRRSLGCSSGGRFGIDLVPDLSAWDEYRRKVRLRGRAGARRRITLVESVRQDRRRGVTIFDEEFTTTDGRRTSRRRFDAHVPHGRRRRNESRGLSRRAGCRRPSPWPATTRAVHGPRASETWLICCADAARTPRAGRVLEFPVRVDSFWRKKDMSGHSKWHTIKHKKGAADAKRGRIFTRIIKELTVAARNGGGDPDMNPRLRTIIADAKQVNMPADNIKRAIRRGTGEEEGVTYDEVTYEGYGPGGVAILVETLTDNRNRTVGEIRHTFGKYGGNLGEANSVGWMFEKKGLVIVAKDKAAEDALMNAALDAGADDMKDDGSAWEIVSPPDAHPAVVDAIKALGVEPDTAQIAMLPQNYIKLEGRAAQQMLKLMEALEEHDDTKNVWSNVDIDEKEIEASLA